MGENPRASSRRAAPPFSTADPFAGSDSADRTVRRAARHGGGVKLLLRCLQSIQCQYYLVFGVVKTVPLCSLSRDCASRSVPALSLCHSLCLSLSFCPSSPPHHFHHRLHSLIITPWRYNGSTTTWRTVIDTYTYCIYSVYVVPLLLIPRVPTRVVRAAFRPHLIPPSLRPLRLPPRLSLIRRLE